MEITYCWTRFGSSGAVAGTNVYYNPPKELNATTINSTIIFKRHTNRWGNSTGNKCYKPQRFVSAVERAALLVEADTNKKDNPSRLTWTLTATLVSGTPLVVDEQLIPYAQTGKNTIGDFNRIHRKRAFLNNSANEWVHVDLNGANILNITSTTDNEAFVSANSLHHLPLPLISTTSTVEVPEFFNFIAHAVYRLSTGAEPARTSNRKSR